MKQSRFAMFSRNRIIGWFALLLVVPFFFQTSPDGARAQLSAQYVNKPYNDVTWVMSHNSTSTSIPLGNAPGEMGFVPGGKDYNFAVDNQAVSIASQFAGGVRAFKLPIHWDRDPSAYAIEYLQSKLNGTLDKLSAIHTKIGAKNCDALKSTTSVPCGFKKESYSCKKPYGSTCHHLPCVKMKDTTCSRLVQINCPTPLETAASKACELAVESLNSSLEPLQSLEKDLTEKISTLGSPVMSYRPWVCHGVAKSDWDTVGKGIITALAKSGKLGDAVKKALAVFSDDKVDIPFMPCIVDLQRQPFVTVMEQFKLLMEAAPTEIVSFYLQTEGKKENKVSPDAMLSDMKSAGLDHLALSRSKGDPWPTVGAMIKNGTRLVVLANNSGGLKTPTSWYQSFGDNVFSTIWQFPIKHDRKQVMPVQLANGIKDLGDLSASCALASTRADQELFLVQHMITFRTLVPPLVFSGAPMGANAANTLPLALYRLNGCWKAQGRKPNFLLVDFVNLPVIPGSGSKGVLNNPLIANVAVFGLQEKALPVPNPSKP